MAVHPPTFCSVSQLEDEGFLSDESGPGEFRDLDLLEDVLRRAGNDLIVCEPQRVQYGDYETLQRYTMSNTAVIEWRGSRGSGDLTGTRFESAADAERWIVADASGYIRDDRGLPIAHWLPDQEHELPEGFTLEQDGAGVLLTWSASGTEHRVRFGGALPEARAVQFSAVARVPLDQIEECALQLDARSAFAAAASATSRWTTPSCR